MLRTSAQLDLQEIHHSSGNGPEKASVLRGGSAGLAAVFLPVAFALVIGATFISVYLAAFSAPTPHDVRVAVVGSTADTAQVRARLSTQQPGGFQVRVMDGAASARLAIEHGDIYAAYVAGDTPKLLYAGARGPSA